MNTENPNSISRGFIKKPVNSQIEHNFKYHPPTGSDPVKHARIRDKAKELAFLIDELLSATAGREKATAITKCEEAMMWACAGICRHPEPEPMQSGFTR